MRTKNSISNNFRSIWNDKTKNVRIIFWLSERENCKIYYYEKIGETITMKHLVFRQNAYNKILAYFGNPWLENVHPQNLRKIIMLNYLIHLNGLPM